MIDHPRLTTTDADEPAIAVTLDPSGGSGFAQPSRETLALSTRAAALVVDDLAYDEREEVAPVTTKVLLLTGGISVPGEGADAAETIGRLHTPEGGKHPTDAEIERVADYLRNAAIEGRLRWLAEELVEESGLSEVMSTDEIGTQRERMNGLRGIAKDL